MLTLILIEGSAISVAGGIIGLGLGVLTMHPVAVCLAGPIGAFYPAWRATLLNPADALRRN